MNAAKLALETCAHLFPHLNYQKRIMERSFKRQGVVTDTIRETWYQETLKKRQELGLDKPDVELKQEEEMEDTERRESLEDVDMDLAEEEEEQAQPPTAAPSSQPEVTTEASSASAKKTDQQEAVRAEIREIEEKLQRKKQKKVAMAKKGEIEDGECVDSEEDEEPAVAAKEAPEEVKDKHREDQRKRWCDDRRDRRDRQGREQRERDRESHYRYERRERDRAPPYYEYDHRQPRY